LQAGDNVVVRTVEGWFVYQLKKDQIVLPSEVWVLNDVPTDEFSAGASVITLTTCHPRWDSDKRWIWWGELISSHKPKDVPVEVLEG
jgi:LPXTG-site transpeptidase (sortase) family protein